MTDRPATAVGEDGPFLTAETVIAHAEAVRGEVEKARDWLTRPNRALGGEMPLSLLDTDLGAREVDEVLERLEHGIFG